MLFACSLFITRVTKACNQRRIAGSGIAKSDPQNIGIHGKSADFRGRYIIGTLTNNANIIIYSIT